MSYPVMMMVLTVLLSAVCYVPADSAQGKDCPSARSLFPGHKKCLTCTPASCCKFGKSGQDCVLEINDNCYSKCWTDGKEHITVSCKKDGVWTEPSARITKDCNLDRLYYN